MAHEYGTNAPFKVAGFASGICPECKGLPLEAYPKAHGGKVDRFYWREIFKTKCQLTQQWLSENNERVSSIIEFRSRFPQIDEELRKEARKLWQRIHKSNPRYNVKETTEAEFLADVEIPARDFEGSYSQIERGGQLIGKWVGSTGDLIRVEDFVAERYHSDGYQVIHAEGVLVSCWVAAFLWHVIQDRADPRQQMSLRMSSRGWPANRADARQVSFLLPADFGSVDYYVRRRDAIDSAISAIESEHDLPARYTQNIGPSESLRDYLWVNEDRFTEAAGAALETLPSAVVVASLQWVLGDFNARRAGWPDLLVFRDNGCFFVEVKSPHDKLSSDQMRWFRWAVEDAKIPCLLARVKRK
jgi:hypothetical protein